MPPHILWFVMEDTSPRLGCYGDTLAETPNIDRLAADGRRYDRMFSTTGVCAPSRASLMTGMMPQQLGAQHMRTDTHDVEGLVRSYECVPPHYVTAFTEYLRTHGYYCTLDEKTDYQFGEPPTMWDAHRDGAGWWDEARDPGQPFFAMMTNRVTHESGMWDPHEGGREPEGGVVATPDTDPAAVAVPPYLADTERTRTAIARQYDNIAAADAWVGEVLDRLERDGFAEDTIIVLVGDHGEGLPRKKRWPYDSGTHVPLIVRWPGETSGGQSDRLVSGVDVPATTLSLAGISPPAYMDGRPFIGPEATDREYVVTTRDRVDESYDMIRSIRDSRYRYVRHWYPERPYVQHIPYRDRHPAMQELRRRHAQGTLDETTRQWIDGTRPAEELYDLDVDPHERANLVDDPTHADVLERLRQELETWRTRTGDTWRGDESEAEMRDRMWPGGDQPSTTAPSFVLTGPRGTKERLASEQTVKGPVTVSLYCPTQGASLSYAMEGIPQWNLYDGPIRLDPGTRATIKARAVRYGYEPSAIVEQTFDVTAD